MLEAAAAVIASTGYEAATMSAIAERAGAPIGSLYQFFPNKQAITHALRTAYGEDYADMLSALESETRSLDEERLDLNRLVTHLVNRSIKFVEIHPGFLALLDAPSSTRSPVALRRTLRLHLAKCFGAVRPGLAKSKALRLATVTLQMVKGLNQLYGEASPLERTAFVREYRVAISRYLSARLNGSKPA